MKDTRHYKLQPFGCIWMSEHGSLVRKMRLGQFGEVEYGAEQSSSANKFETDQ